MAAIQLVGSDFHLTSPSRLEQLSHRREEIQARLLELRAKGRVRGAVVLSTCNRFEVLLEVDGGGGLDPRADVLGVDVDFPVHVHAGPEAVEHLLGVTSGLRSMAFGEEQILGQVRSAFRGAEEFGMVSRRLHMLCTRLLHTAREVRHRIGLDQRPRSVAALAVDRLADAGSRFAVVGTGEMGRLVLEIMQRRHLPTPLVVNRTLPRATALAEHYGGAAMSLQDFLQKRPELDGVVFATGSSGPVFGKAHAAGLKIVVDISQPSVLAGDVREVEGLEVHNLDDFARAADAEQQQYASVRETGLEEVKALAARLWQDVDARRPNLGRVVDLHVEGALAELEHALSGRLRHLPEGDRRTVRDVLLRAAKRNAHHHICDLRQLACQR